MGVVSLRFPTSIYAVSDFICQGPSSFAPAELVFVCNVVEPCSPLLFWKDLGWMMEQGETHKHHMQPGRRQGTTFDSKANTT